jgi:hypothetical protein
VSGAPWWEDFHPETGTATRAPRTAEPAPPASPAPPVLVAPDAPDAPPRLVRSPRPAGPPRGLQATAAVLSLVLLAMVGLLAARTLTAPGDRTAGPSPAPATQRVAAPPGAGRTGAADARGAGGPGGTAGTAGTGGTAATDAAATAELESLRASGLAAHPPTGQWVAQLSAKSAGTTDPVQTASNGSSTFYAADILAQSREIASGAAGGDVFVLKTTDFGEGLLDARGNPYWVTLAAGPFGDAEDVRTWCASMFADTPADRRANACLPKQLTPPG